MHKPSFDHHARGRVYFINEGTDSWAVNDVTAARSPEAVRTVKSASEMLRKYPSRWVAFAPTREAAIEAAERDAEQLQQGE